MLLKQEFKTLTGAQKRCDFENGLQGPNGEFVYRVRWFVDGQDITDKRASHVARQGAVKHWQLEKKRRLGPVGYKRR